MSVLDPASLDWAKTDGLIPAIVQDVVDGTVLMLGYMNREALERTLTEGQVVFYSRSRQRLWQKGETSGNFLEVVDVLTDCDRDALLMRVRPAGPACHRGTRSCFEPNPARLELGWLWQVLESRQEADAESSYTARLLQAGLPRIAQKVGEEATETVIAALTSTFEDRGELVEEASDLLYHLLVLLLAAGVEPGEVAKKLGERHRGGGGE